MNQLNKTLLVCWVLASALFVAPLFAAGNRNDGPDTIHLKGKAPLKDVKVVSENASEIVYTKKRSSRRVTLSADQVASISYEAQPASYRSAIQLFALGDFMNAITKLQPLSKKADSEAPWVQEYALVYLGRAQLSAGQFAEAAVSLKKALATNPKSRWQQQIARGLTTAFCNTSKFDQAQKAVDALRAAVTAQKIPGEAAVYADVLACEVLLRSGKLTQCSSKANTAAANAAKFAPVSARAHALQIEALIGTKDLPRARAVIQGLKTQAARGNVHAAAAARNGEAAVLLSEGKELERAIGLLAQAHVENWQGISEMPTTCYLLGRSYLAASETARSADAKTLARAYFEETTSRFPESTEAILARAELKKL